MNDENRLFGTYLTGESTVYQWWNFVYATALLGFALTIVLAGVAACSLVLMLAFYSGVEGISAVPASDLKHLALVISRELHWIPIGAYSMAISSNLIGLATVSR